MSFWEEIGQKISRGGQEAIQKTKDMASILSLKADINDAQKHIKELEAEIGKIVVESEFEGLNKEELRKILEEDTAETKSMTFGDWKVIWEKVMMIRADEELIAIDEKKISELDDKVKCASCGSTVTKGATFCPECGARMVYPETSETEEDTVMDAEVVNMTGSEEKEEN